MYDVIVVGAGPVGSRVAERLAGAGQQVLVLERKPAPGSKLCCTGIIGMECLEAFSIDPSVVLRHYRSANLFSPSGELVRVEREQDQACIVDRDSFDKSLAGRARKAGAEFRFNCEVVEHEGGPGGSVKVVCKENGRTDILDGRAIVYACGYSPQLISSLGMGRHGDVTTGVQAEVEAASLEEVEVYFGDVSPKFFGWLAPTVPGQARAGLLARRNPHGLLKAWLKQLAAQGKILTADVPFHYGCIPLKPLPRTFGNRVLVVGDAAGQVKPVTGGGIYYGLLCADIAAEHLCHALKSDDLSAASLSGYERDWRQLLGNELREGYFARRVYERTGHGFIDRLFRAVREQGIARAMLRDPELKFDWHRGALRRFVKRKPGLAFRAVLNIPFSGR